jgi:hypothetical protein
MKDVEGLKPKSSTKRRLLITNISVNWTARKLCLKVPSALRAPAVGDSKR